MMMPRRLHPSKRKVEEHLMNADAIEEEAGNANSADSAAKVGIVSGCREDRLLPSSDVDDRPRHVSRRRPRFRWLRSGQEISAIRRRFGEISCPPQSHAPRRSQRTDAPCSGLDAERPWKPCLGVNDDFRTILLERVSAPMCHHSAIAFMRSLILIVAKFEYVSAMA